METKMKLMFQDTGFTFQQIDVILDALQKISIVQESFGLISFSNEFNYELDEPTILFGSCKMLKMYVNGYMSNNAIVFYSDLFDQRNYHTILNKELLNKNATFMKWGDLKSQIPKERCFVKPSQDLKYFAGKIVNPNGDTFEHLIKEGKYLNSDIDDNVDILINYDLSIKIDNEYRVVVIDNKVVDISQYMCDNKILHDTVDIHIYESIERYVYEIMSVFKPHDHYVIDIYRSDNVFGIVEYNCINISGFYKCDRSKIYKLFSELLC
jgi:hypothetical protein